MASRLFISFSVVWFSLLLAVNSSASTQVVVTAETSQIVKQKACIDFNTRLTDAYANANSACRAAGKSITDCGEIMDSCEQSASGEVAIPNLPMAIQAGPRCSSYSQSDWDSAKRNLDREKQDSERDLKDLRQRRSDSDRELAEKKGQLTDEYQQAFEDKDKADAEAKEKERVAIAEEQQALQQLERDHAQINIELTKLQLARSEILQRRASEIDQYNLGIVQCKADTKKFAREMQANTAASLKSLQSGGGSRKADIQAFWEACVNGVLNRRTAEADRARLALQENEQQKENLLKQQADITQQIQLFKQTSAKAAAERAQNAQKAEEQFMQRQQTRLQRLIEFDQKTRLQQMEMMQSIGQAQSRIFQKSNEMQNLLQEKPTGKFGSEEVQKRYDSYVRLKSQMDTMGCTVPNDLKNPSSSGTTRPGTR